MKHIKTFESFNTEILEEGWFSKSREDRAKEVDADPKSKRVIKFQSEKTGIPEAEMREKLIDFAVDHKGLPKYFSYDKEKGKFYATGIHSVAAGEGTVGQ